MKGRPGRGRTAAAVLGLLLALMLGACACACASRIALPATAPSSSAASPEPAEPTGTLLTSVDEQLDDLIAEIQQNRDDVDIPGYTGVAVDAEHRALDLWWVGEPPERIQRLIATPPHGLVIRLHPATYDVATMIPAVDELMNRYPVIHAASPESDGSGVEVETTTKGERSLPSPARLAEQVGMPVRVVISSPPVPA